MDLLNKVAVVTGGASGLGKATAEKLIAGGAKVAIFDMNEAEGNVVAKQLGSNAIFCSVNVTEEASITSAIETVMTHFGALHICVNCAGRGGGATKTLGRAGRFPMELFKNVIDINLIGTFNVLTQCSEKMALTSAITSPMHPEVMQAVRGGDVMMGHDPNCTHWIRAYREPAAEGEGRGGRSGRSGRRRSA